LIEGNQVTIIGKSNLKKMIIKESNFPKITN
jgi:hypothetical protein